MDFSRQLLDKQGLDSLMELAKERNVRPLNADATNTLHARALQLGSRDSGLSHIPSYAAISQVL